MKTIEEKLEEIKKVCQELAIDLHELEKENTDEDSPYDEFSEGREAGKRVIVTDGKYVGQAWRRKSDGQWNGWQCLDDEYLEQIIGWQYFPQI
jgi:hypothetical protein